MGTAKLREYLLNKHKTLGSVLRIKYNLSVGTQL